MGFFLQFVSIVLFTFAAPAFTVLAVSYWRQEHRRDTVFHLLTMICAVVFLANLASVAFFLDYPAIIGLRAFLVSLLPPMMFHIVLKQRRETRARFAWTATLLVLYSATIASAAASFTPWRDLFSVAPAIVLCAASVCSLGVLAMDYRQFETFDRLRRIWKSIIFALLCATAIAALVNENPFFDLVPDYLVLLFVAVHLYYTERLAFFDTFAKVGSYFAAGAALLGLLLLSISPFREVFLGDWIRAWVGILALMPVWLLGPFIFRGLGRWADRLLHRKYTPIQAEQFFIQSLQVSDDEMQLRDNAARSLEEIFQCVVEIDFTRPSYNIHADELVAAIGAAGYVRLFARANRIPFLSDDRRLLETLSANLSLLLQNVRLRLQQQEQQRREQELASLANRAELRALRAQINPHFLFNALNAIAGWIRTEPEFADEILAELAEVFRYTLHRSNHEWVRVQDEVEFIRAYLAVERARFRDRLQILVSVADAAKAIQIPAMMIQPLIENAIKHGILPVSVAGTVAIAITAQDGRLRIEVSDTGPGFPPGFCLEKSRQGHGLRNVIDRLKGYYGDLGAIRLDQTDAGTIVTLELPQRRPL